jgi:hypothetical protein
MRPARRILVTKSLHLVTEFAKGSSCRSAGQSCSDYYNLQLAFVAWVYQLAGGLIIFPFLI